MHSCVVTAVIVLAGVLLILYLAGIRFYAVETGSMQLAIPVNSICFVNQKVPFSKIIKGDVIVFCKGDMTVTHRVTEVTDAGLLTKGDANNLEDTSLVTEENYNGKLILTIPKVGIVVRLTRTLPGMLTAITVFLVMQILTLMLKKS